jgi:hypothetical protein
MMIERNSSFNNGGAADRASTASVAQGAVPTHGLMSKIYHSKRVRLLLIICVLVIGFTANIQQQNTTSFLVVGGAIGAASSVCSRVEVCTFA